MWSGILFGAKVAFVAVIGAAIIYGLLWLALGERPTYGVRIISDAAPCEGIEYVQPAMVDPDAMPDTGASYTVKSPLSFDGLPGELNFVSLDMVLFTISQVQDGKFTVTLGPDYIWDEAGEEFWRLMEKFAAPNALIWRAKP